MRFAERMDLLKTESAFVVLAKAQELEREGRDIIHLEIGDTDFDTPAHIVDEASLQLASGQTHYCGSSGLRELREACCEFLRRDSRHQVQAQPEVFRQRLPAVRLRVLRRPEPLHLRGADPKAPQLVTVKRMLPAL